MLALKSIVSCSTSIRRNPRIPISLFFSSSFSSESKSNKLLYDYLVKEGISIPKSVSISNRFTRVNSLKRAESAFRYFRELGLSDSQIQSAVCVQPQILFADVEKTLKPKITFFQNLGFTDSNLSQFMSKNSSLLTISVDRKLVPCVEILKRILLKDKIDREVVSVLQKCGWVISRNPQLFLVPNIAFLESCGIVGSRLSFLLRRQPRLFVAHEARLRTLVSRCLDLGFSKHSGMLVYAVFHLSGISTQTMGKKIKLFESFGFSRDETLNMFKKTPSLICSSEEKLKLGFRFYMDSVGLTKDALVRAPTCLMYSFEMRVIPRFKVLEVLKSKGLLKKNPSSVEVVVMTEDVFLRRFISRFEEHVEELLVAYKGHLLDSS